MILAILVAFPFRSPAPLIYRPGEGWTYEPVGSEGKWQRGRAKDQLDVAQAAFDKKDYGLALKAARRVVKVWPLSDYAPQAQFLVAKCYDAKNKDYKAFKEYQRLIEKSPRGTNFAQISERQFEIANRYLAGKWFRLWGVIPFFPSMDKTAQMYEKIVKNGPYSEVAPKAQLNIGRAREKQRDYPLAVKAYELASDRYFDRPQYHAEALYREGVAFHKQAQTAEYDQTAAGRAIAVFTDFMTLYPEDPRVPETQKVIAKLKSEQATGSYRIARFYEKKKKWWAARTYYNEVVQQDPGSPYAEESKVKIETLRRKLEGTPPKEQPEATPKTGTEGATPTPATNTNK